MCVRDAGIERRKNWRNLGHESLGVLALSLTLQAECRAFGGSLTVALERTGHVFSAVTFGPNPLANRFHIDSDLKFRRTRRFERDDGVIPRGRIKCRTGCGNERLEGTDGVPEVGIRFVDGGGRPVERGTNALDFRRCRIRLGAQTRLFRNDLGVSRIRGSQIGECSRGKGFRDLKFFAASVERIASTLDFD